jgi:hypothetical protein
MLKSWFNRLAVVGGIIVTVIGASAGPAMAANTIVIDVDEARGHMRFIDNGDDFIICDDRVDGHGVTGKLFERAYLGRPAIEVLSINDGGDSGCDYGHYPVVGGNDYQMRIYWNGGERARGPWFVE